MFSVEEASEKYPVAHKGGMILLPLLIPTYTYTYTYTKVITYQ